MPVCKILASDLDGTLLDRFGGISEENTAAIHALAARGIEFVPSSGRTYSDMPEFLRNNPDIRYYICSDGAAVFDKKTGERLELCIPKALSQKVLDVVFSCDVHITYRHMGRHYAARPQQTPELFAYYDVMPRHREVVEQCAEYLDDFRERIYDADNIEMIDIHFHDPAEMEDCRNRLEALGGLHLASVVYNNFEIFSEAAGKGNALLRLAEKLGVRREETVSVGDSDNDIALIEAAGTGLAVSNACEALKRAADGVICSYEEHAVPYILKHYIER